MRGREISPWGYLPMLRGRNMAGVALAIVAATLGVARVDVPPTVAQIADQAIGPGLFWETWRVAASDFLPEFDATFPSFFLDEMTTRPLTSSAAVIKDDDTAPRAGIFSDWNILRGLEEWFGSHEAIANDPDIGSEAYPASDTVEHIENTAGGFHDARNWFATIIGFASSLVTLPFIFVGGLGRGRGRRMWLMLFLIIPLIFGVLGRQLPPQANFHTYSLDLASLQAANSATDDFFVESRGKWKPVPPFDPARRSRVEAVNVPIRIGETGSNQDLSACLLDTGASISLMSYKVLWEGLMKGAIQAEDVSLLPKPPTSYG